MIVAFIDEHKHRWGIEPICTVLTEHGCPIAPSTYYAARKRQPSARAVRDGELKTKILDSYNASKQVYGIGKIHADLKRQGIEVAQCTVERLCRELGIRGVVRGKYPRTTRPAPETDRPGDRVRRDFTADGPNQLWVADITYVRTTAGWVYVAFILDVYSRMIVGWQSSTRMFADLAVDALAMALWNRRRHGHSVVGLVHHSDRGVQYRAVRYTEELERARAVTSVGSKGDSYDNAMAEALNSLYKHELIYRHTWADAVDVEYATAEWVTWYNHHRLHGALGYIPPAELEAAYWARENTNETAPEPALQNN